MFRHTIPIGRVLGIPIDLDYSWFLIAVLITWLLAVNYYPATFKGGTGGEYWLMGAVTAVLFFGSILVHELAHSWVALRYKIPIHRITLFIFGGVSQLAGEPPSAAAEFLIAIAGPLTSFALAAIFFLLEGSLVNFAPALAVAKYLALINGLLGLFNLIPGFPLDGGRVFRAIVWGVNKNFRRATLIAASTGRFFGFLFIVWGVWQILTGRVADGLWIAFIGWFLESAAGAQVQQQMVQGLLVGHKVSEAMGEACTHVPGSTPLQDLVDEQILSHGRRCFLVDQGDREVGLLTLHNLKEVPRSSWTTTTAAQAMTPIEKLSRIDANAELWTAFEKMGRDGINQMPVMRGNELVGMLSRSDVVRYLQTLQQVGTRAA
ncbi:MAG TPA: site-2 protease family protein [Candidatus Acidoferrales bacterium]|nr:site-2 protease family protein [Candidatus Acidoferrales bacterium]